MAVTIDDLPNEILAQIFTYLDRPAPSDSKLHDQPSSLMLQNPFFDRDLKNVSVVTKLWRAAVLPLLFRHVIWTIDRFELPLIEETRDPAATIDFLRFLRDNNLTNYVTTVTMFVEDALGGVATSHLASSVELMETGHANKASYSEDYNWLWRTLFEHVDPVRLSIIASPRVLAQLLSRMLFLGDAWNFDMPQHILSLSRKSKKVVTSKYKSKATASSSRDAPSPENPHQKRVPCDLFTIRPWQSLLLNEGSSTRVYKTYEYYLKRPPSMLGALLGAEEFPNDEPLIAPSIRDFSYVGIFPLSSHFNTLVQHVPRLDRLFVQLVPRNDILQDADEMRNIDIADLWMERNTSYSMLFRELFDPDPDSPWLELKTFESGDAADREAWEMAVQFVQFSGVQGWKVESEGVFVREGNESGPILGMSQLPGQLRRWAFNGVATLPVSSAMLYMGNGGP
ncbi:F-box domain-containing protein [Colletotrichum asianum]